MTTTALRTWTRWLDAHVREARPVSRDDIAYSTPMWKAAWAEEIQQAADRREEIPLPIARSYAHYIGPGAVRNLCAAANADEIAAALSRFRGQSSVRTPPQSMSGC